MTVHVFCFALQYWSIGQVVKALASTSFPGSLLVMPQEDPLVALACPGHSGKQCEEIMISANNKGKEKKKEKETGERESFLAVVIHLYSFFFPVSFFFFVLHHSSLSECQEQAMKTQKIINCGILKTKKNNPNLNTVNCRL